MVLVKEDALKHSLEALIKVLKTTKYIKPFDGNGFMITVTNIETLSDH